MSYVEENVATEVDTAKIASAIGLSVVATFLPFVIHIPLITGPIINALLILILFMVGMRYALLMCFVPSLMALAGGLLPMVLAPIIPFIMLGNVIFILSIDYFYQSAKKQLNGYWIGVFVGAALKYLFIWFNANFMIGFILRGQLSTAAAQIISWPQFATAAVGGVIAWAILKWLKRI